MFQTSAKSFPSENGAGAVQGWRRHRRVSGTSSEPQRVPGLLCQVSSPLPSPSACHLYSKFLLHIQNQRTFQWIEDVLSLLQDPPRRQLLGCEARELHGRHGRDHGGGARLDHAVPAIHVSGWSHLVGQYVRMFFNWCHAEQAELSLFGFLRHAASIFSFLINNASQTSVDSLPSTLAIAILWQVSRRLLAWYSQSQS